MGEALRKMAQKVDGIGVQDIEPLLTQYDYLQAAQALYDGAADQAQHHHDGVSSARRDYRAPSGSSRQDLARGCTVTTTPDTAIEDLPPIGPPARWLWYVWLAQPGNAFCTAPVAGERCILKLHGMRRDQLRIHPVPVS